MSTWYVRKSGSDSNNGTSAATAFLTIQKAINSMAAGDQVWVGAGIYREALTPGASGSNGSQYTISGDVDGVNTGDVGLVCVSAYPSESAEASRANCVSLNKKTFWLWQKLIFDGGTTATIQDTDAVTSTAWEGVEFQDCVIQSSGNNLAVSLNMMTGATPSTAGLTFRRCILDGKCYSRYNLNGTADTNTKMQAQNCLFTGGGGGTCWNWDQGGGSGAFMANGMTFYGCTFAWALTGLTIWAPTATYPMTVKNCLFRGVATPLSRSAGVAGGTSADYNTFTNCGFGVGGSWTDGGHNNTGNANWMGGLTDLPLRAAFGWSPWLPFEPMINADSTYKSRAIDTATSGLVSNDGYTAVRPLGRGYDAGWVEARNHPKQEATTVRTGTYSFRFDGAGYHDFLVPVDAVSTTISVYARYDSNYTGSKPQLIIYGLPGDGSSPYTASMSGAANTWEQLSITLTPASKGVVRARLYSRDTSSTGKAYYDDLVVS